MRTVRHPTAECRSELVRSVCGGKCSSATLALRGGLVQLPTFSARIPNSHFANLESGRSYLFIPIALGALTLHKYIIAHIAF